MSPGPSLARPRSAGVTVWCAPPFPARAGASAWLSPGETARAAGFRREADRDRFTTGRALVRAALGEGLGVAPRDVVVRLASRGGATPGRPFVDGAPSFSIAHAGAWVLVAVAGGRPDGVDVGVDVESTAAARDHLADLLDAVPGGERPLTGWTPASFTRSWVRREAVLKAVGTGLLAPRDDLLLDRADLPARTVHSTGMLPAPDRLALRDLDLPAPPAGATGATGATPPAGATGDGRRTGETYLAAVAICSAVGPVRFSDVELADGLPLLARHGIAAR